jgi:hypothetical protein
MTVEEIRDAISRYTLNTRAERAGNQDVWVAWYSELTGCMVEAPTREDALRELDFQVIPFAQSIVSAAGRLPIPRSARPPKPVTVVQRFSNLIIGNARKLNAEVVSEATTDLETPPRFTKSNFVPA